MNIVSEWFRRHFADPQVVIVAVLLVVGFVALSLVGGTLAPVLASIVIAYMLDSPIKWMSRHGLGRLPAFLFVFLVFLAALLVVLLLVTPLLVGQVRQITQLIPAIVNAIREQVLLLPQMFPDLIEQQQALDLVDTLRLDLLNYGQFLLTYSVSMLPTVITLVVYLVLVPVLVFFFLKDKERLIAWVLSFLPPERPLAVQVWRGVNKRVGGYIRGKSYEMVIVGSVSLIVFALLGAPFAALLATVTGLSVLIPYVGVVLAAVPVIAVGFVTWGTGNELIWILVAYTIIQILDANVLVPLLLSETVDLHPIAIIVAILVFGSLWGFWGVFFAVPLASLIQAVIESWPRQSAAPPQ